jgi:DNA-binding NarL/FixJ family response regulator
MLEAMGMEAFAERARRELAAAGETMANRIAAPARTSSGQVGEQLTAQEAQVAQLAMDGLSNPQIAARLFISTRTVQYHLGKVFAKLGIDSRGQLHRVLPSGPDTFSAQ